MTPPLFRTRHLPLLFVLLAALVVVFLWQSNRTEPIELQVGAQNDVPTLQSTSVTPSTISIPPPLTDATGEIVDHDRLEPAPVQALAIAEKIARTNLETVVGPLTADFSPHLALYTNTDYGLIDPDGSIQPTFVRRLVWAYVATGLKPSQVNTPGGLVGQGGASANTAGADEVTCEAVWLTDGTTGEYLMGYEQCPEDPSTINLSRSE